MKAPVMLILLILLSFSIKAWNERGHMVVASIAYHELSKEKQLELTELLKEHPAFEKYWLPEFEEFSEKIELGEFITMRASVWPDDIRPARGHKPKKYMPEFEKYHRGKWHYVTYRLDFEGGHDTNINSRYKTNNVVWAIENSKSQIENENLPLSERAIAMSWLLHLIGDIHQPLHCASLYNETYPKGDRGGNLFWIRPNQSPRKLHSYWDGGIGSGDNYGTAHYRASDLKFHSPKTANIKLIFDPKKWSIESFEIAKTKAHDNGNLKGSDEEDDAPKINVANYPKRRKNVSYSRGAIAGYRLGEAISKMNIN